MIVDDEHEILNQMKTYLEDNEFDVVTASNSREALELLEDKKEDDIEIITEKLF